MSDDLSEGDLAFWSIFFILTQKMMVKETVVNGTRTTFEAPLTEFTRRVLLASSRGETIKIAV